MKEPLYTFKTENGNIPVWNGSFLCFPTKEQAALEGKKFNATHTLALLAHEGGQWATITEEEIEPISHGRYSFRKVDGEMPMPDEKGGDNRLLESKEEAVKAGLIWGADMVCLMGQRTSGVWEIIEEEPIEP